MILLFLWGVFACAPAADQVATTALSRSSFNSGRKRSRVCASGLEPRHEKDQRITLLSRFFDEEKPIVRSTIDRAVEALKCAIDNGLVSAMNTFNKSEEI